MTLTFCISRHRRAALLVLGVIGLQAGLPAMAHADCQSGIAKLKQRMTHVADAKLKALLQADLKAAEQEMWEFDESECAEQLDHAEQLLAAQPADDTASAQTSGPATAPAN